MADDKVVSSPVKKAWSDKVAAEAEIKFHGTPEEEEEEELSTADKGTQTSAVEPPVIACRGCGTFPCSCSDGDKRYKYIAESVTAADAAVDDDKTPADGLHPWILAMKKQSAEELSDVGYGDGEKGLTEAEATRVESCSCGCGADSLWKCPHYFQYPPYYPSEELKVEYQHERRRTPDKVSSQIFWTPQKTVEVVSPSPPPPPSPAVATAAAVAAAEEEKQKRREDLAVHLMRQLSVRTVPKEEEEKEEATANKKKSSCCYCCCDSMCARHKCSVSNKQPSFRICCCGLL